MDTIIKIIGVLFILSAILYIAKPIVITVMMNFFIKGKRLYLAALIRFALAIIFLLAATKCKMPIIIAALGVLFLLAGLLFFILGLEKIKTMLNWWLSQPLIYLRIIATVTLILGAIIIYAA